MLKTSAMIIAKTLQQLFNEALDIGEFPRNLKDADVTPVFKKKFSVSVLPIISKAFEKLMQNEINLHVQYFLSLFLCGYRKGF